MLDRGVKVVDRSLYTEAAMRPVLTGAEALGCVRRWLR